MVFSQYSQEQQETRRMQGPNSMEKDRSATPLLVSSRQDANVDYSPDGNKLAFSSSRSGFFEIWTSNSEGTRPMQLTNLRNFSGTPRWSPDGRWIAFDSRPEDHSEIYVIDAEGGVPERLTHERSDNRAPSWSRDGRWIFFASNRSGTYQVWKIPSEGGKAIQVTQGGGYCARESSEGRMLYYTRPGGRSVGSGPIWRVPCDGGEETPVLNREILWADWAVRPEGLYFATQTGKKYLIEFFSFQTGKVVPFYQEETLNVCVFLTISPDGKWLLYTEYIYPESDLMLVENFR
jgi:Tol biopolymer transport system component